MSLTHVPGEIYLLHFEPRVEHAGHYLGWTSNLDERIETHLRGAGSPLVRAAVQRGCTVTLARTWQGDRYFERKLKNRGGAARICPICQGRSL